MAEYRHPLISGNYYHVFNRGIDKRNTFYNDKEFNRFRRTLYYFNFQQSQPTIQSSPASATQDTEHNSSPSALPLDSVESNLDSVDINAELDAALIQLDNEASAF